MCYFARNKTYYMWMSRVTCVCVWVCVCMCVCVCVCVCMHIPVYICISIKHTGVHMYIWIWTHDYMHTHAYLCHYSKMVWSLVGTGTLSLSHIHMLSHTLQPTATHCNTLQHNVSQVGSDELTFFAHTCAHTQTNKVFREHHGYGLSTLCTSSRHV